ATQKAPATTPAKKAQPTQAGVPPAETKKVVGSPPKKETAPPTPVVGGDAQPNQVTNRVGMRLVLIPAGRFLMGSPPNEEGRDNKNNDEGPVREVTISRPFYLGACEVTVGEFRAFVLAEGYQTDAERTGEGGYGYNEQSERVEGPAPRFTWRNVGWEQSDRHPVVNVTYNDALAFCRWLGQQEGKRYRLPTEAEWEYACRA